jgi:hypothetical protein
MVNWKSSEEAVVYSKATVKNLSEGTAKSNEYHRRLSAYSLGFELQTSVIRDRKARRYNAILVFFLHGLFHLFTF